MLTIGLLAAMPLERDALLRLIPASKPVSLGAYHPRRFDARRLDARRFDARRFDARRLDARRFDLSGCACLLVTSGMGARRAAEAAHRLLETAAPQMLVSFGIAGAVEADLQIGDVILAETACRLEQGVPGPLLPLAAFPPPARNAAAQALTARGARLFTGTALTTSGPQVTTSQLAQMPHPVLEMETAPGGSSTSTFRLAATSHPVLEMETAAVALAAAEKGIPLYAIRAISDNPLAPLPLDPSDLLDADANLRPIRLLKAILHRPSILLQSRRMIQNSNIAAQNAALALLAALSHMAF